MSALNSKSPLARDQKRRRCKVADREKRDWLAEQNHRLVKAARKAAHQ